MKRMLSIAAAIFLVAVAMPATAQEYTFDGDYHARVGFGDIPRVDANEPGDAWNVAEYLRFDHDGNQTSIPLGSSDGTIIDASCACGNVSIQGANLVIRDAEAGSHIVRLVRSLGTGDSILVDFALYAGQSGDVVAYLPQGYHADTGAQGSQPLNCTDAPCTIQEFPAGTSHFAILPGAAPQTGTIVTPEDEEGPLDDLLPILLGLLAGIMLWAFLVQRGYVQKRRAQEVKKAAHVEAKETESQAMLKARKRVLMAGLKDLEMAKMNKEIESADYDALKTELKQQAVTVMRAIDSE